MNVEPLRDLYEERKIGITQPEVMDLPGIHEVTSEAYHACRTRISRGQLWTLHSKSPAHLKHELDNPTPTTRAMLRGQALHVAILEPALFSQFYAIPPECDRRTKDGKARWEAFVTECDCTGKEILGWDPSEEKLYRDDVEAVLGIARNLGADARLTQLFRDGKGTTESTYCWDEDQSKFRVRFDRLNQTPRGWVSLDLKSTQDARPSTFQRTMVSHGYHFQAAMYSDGFEALHDEKLRSFVFVAYEPDPPYAHAFFECSSDVLECGRMEYRQAVDRLRQCQESGQWPSYESSGVQTLNMPTWYK